MKFKFVNEGSRGEVESYVGGINDLDYLVERFINEKDELGEFGEIGFGGLSRDCFVEIVFGEEDSYFVYLLNNS